MKLTKSLFILSACLLGELIPAAFGKWEINDVSYLYNLPTKNSDSSDLLSINSQGKKGELFPAELGSLFASNFVVNIDSPKNVLQTLRVVGVRIDDCFKFSEQVNERCSPQIRMVWQPIINLGTNKVSTWDAAIHSFYELTPSEFEILKQKLQKLKRKYHLKTNDLPLGIHPGFTSSRSSAFTKEFNTTVLSLAGSENLLRFTFMKMITKDLWWSFGGFDKNINSEWLPIGIPRMKSTDLNQDFFNESINDETGMIGAFVPMLQAPRDNLSKISRGGQFYNEDASRVLFQDAIQTWNKVQNPNLTNPNNIDCVTCHIAEPVQSWAEIKHRKYLDGQDTETMKYSQSFVSNHNLKNVTNKKQTTKSLRSFGYFKNLPSINQRVINESAEVANSLNKIK